MAFAGYLISIGSRDTFFNNFIKASTYKVAKKVIDVDSYRDTNGMLHRNAMEHLSYTVEMEIKPLDGERLATLMSAISSNFIIPIERKLSLTFFLPEINDYVTADCYMPDIDFPINHIEPNNIIKYDSFTIKFIGY